MMLECFRNQTYPKDRMEWIIVDDGTDKVRDLIEAAGIKQIRYFDVDEKMSLGKKRNYMHSFVKGTIIVYMDDDDYYPPERVSHAVEKLTQNREAMCAGSSELYIYFKHIKQMYKCGPYGPNHATAGTFAFRTELLKDSRYEDTAALAEEKHFLKNYTVPFVQLDPMKSILVFSHNHNTFDKKKLLDNAHPDYFRPSPITVDMFIQEPKEAWIKDFFLDKIDDMLAGYEAGEPKMKPDVLKQTKEIEMERAKMMEQNQANSPIMMSKDGEPPKALTNQEIITIINAQKTDIQNLVKKNEELQNIAIQLQNQLIQVSSGQQIQELMNRVKELETQNNVLENQLRSSSTDSKSIDISEIVFERSKSEPEVIL